MEKEIKFETIENFLYFADDVGFIYREYIRLKQENAELRAQLQEERNSIIDMANRSQKSVDDFVNAILSGEISVDGKKHKDCGIRVSGPQQPLI